MFLYKYCFCWCCCLLVFSSSRHFVRKQKLKTENNNGTVTEHMRNSRKGASRVLRMKIARGTQDRSHFHNDVSNEKCSCFHNLSKRTFKTKQWSVSASLVRLLPLCPCVIVLQVPAILPDFSLFLSESSCVFKQADLGNNRSIYDVVMENRMSKVKPSLMMIATV